MKDFAITDTKIAYYGYIYKYVKGKNEKDVLKKWIENGKDLKDCKIIKKPENVMLKWGAKYCFEKDGIYYYCYEVKE